MSSLDSAPMGLGEIYNIKANSLLQVDFQKYMLQVMNIGFFSQHVRISRTPYFTQRYMMYTLSFRKFFSLGFSCMALPESSMSQSW